MEQVLSEIADKVATEAGNRVLESHRLKNFLLLTGEREVEATRAFLMNLWTEEQGVYSYEIGLHDVVWAMGYQITFDGVWHFENLEKDAPIQNYFECLDGLKTTERLIKQGIL